MEVISWIKAFLILPLWFLGWHSHTPDLLSATCSLVVLRLCWCVMTKTFCRAWEDGGRGYPPSHEVFTDRTLVKQLRWQSLLNSQYVSLDFTADDKSVLGFGVVTQTTTSPSWLVSRARRGPQRALGLQQLRLLGCFELRFVCRRDVWCSSAFVMVDCSAFQTRNEDQACFQWASMEEGGGAAVFE